ncbi:MAG: VOC family protein [Anaerolineae bacterium]|nr:VOC family protein [Anaerolineae bacterium]
MKACINHVAVLLPSLTNAITRLRKDGINVEPPQKFISEGTEESYAGLEKLHARLLLMTPIGTGQYKRALEKRGAGLHHIAIDVDDIEAFIFKMSSTGWLLHPSSLQRYKEGLAIYFARPGVNTLIEVEKRKVKIYDNFINKIYIPVERGKEKYITDLSLKNLIPTTSKVFKFQINSKMYTIKMLL